MEEKISVSDNTNQAVAANAILTEINQTKDAAQKILAMLQDMEKTAKNAVEQISAANVPQVLDGLKVKANEINEISGQMIALKTKITDTQGIIATKSDHIQKAQEHADTVRANLDRELTAAKQKVTDVEGDAANVAGISKESTQSLAQIQTIKATSDASLKATIESQNLAETSAVSVKKLADKAAEIETNLKNYESQLQQLRTTHDEQVVKIKSLLPGATSAGLAHSFDERRKSFLSPQNKWQRLFICSLSLIVVVTAWSFINSLYHPAASWDELERIWLTRLPLIGALIWLAIHSSHEAALAKRLEEDYGYKTAISACFEGFKEQLEAIEKTDSNHALATLLKNTLGIIATPPGRIYENHPLAVSPTSELGKIAKDLMPGQQLLDSKVEK